MRFLISVKAFVVVVMELTSQSYAQTDTIPAKALQGSAVARRNYYYLPAEVLKFTKELALTRDQVFEIDKIAATLKLKERETTSSATRNENMLDSLFRKNKLNEGVIIFYTNRYGLYEGEYRGAVLLACYNTRKVLTPQQLNKLATLANHN